MVEKAFGLLEHIINEKKILEERHTNICRKDALKREDIRHLKFLERFQKEELEKLSQVNQKTKELLNKYDIIEADKELIENLIKISEDCFREVKSSYEPENIDEHIELNKKLTEINSLFRGYLTEDYEWLRIDEALSKYRIRQGIDIEKERTIEIPISNNRKIFISIFENGLEATINTEPFEDPNKVKLEDAPYGLIGGKLTQEDSEKITNILCNLKGEIGNSARAYQKIIRKWIYFTENKKEWKKTLTLGDLGHIEGEVSAERDAAASRLNNVFSHGVSLVNLILGEIFTDAIYQKALNNFSV